MAQMNTDVKTVPLNDYLKSRSDREVREFESSRVREFESVKTLEF